MEKVDFEASRDDGGEDEGTAGDEDKVCEHCGYEPCLVLELRPMFEAIVQAYLGEKTNKQIRFKIYTDSVLHINGSGLGVGVRKRLPHCVQKIIRRFAPDKDYTGFKEADNKQS